MNGDNGIDTDAETDCNGINKVLNRINKRKRGHCVLADFCDKIAVDNIIKRVDKH